MRGLVVVLLMISGVASADEPACKPTGKVMLEVEHQATGGAKIRTARTRLYRNGAWTMRVRDREGGRAREVEGCLAASDVTTIRNAVEGAAWKATRGTPTCRPSARLTVYTWNGRALYRGRSCDGQKLDAASRRALSLIDVLLHAETDLREDDPDAFDKTCLDNPLAKGCSR